MEIYEEAVIEMAEYLYEKGIKKDYKNYENFTMLELALYQENYTLAHWLIEKKVSSFKDTELIKKDGNKEIIYILESRFSKKFGSEPITTSIH